MTPTSWRAQAAAASACAAAVVLLGAPVGLIWAALAPRLDFVDAAGQGLTLVDSESEALVAADGYFLFITVVVGIACGLAAYGVGRLRHGPGLVAGLGAGGLAASVVAAQVGRRLHLSSFDHAQKAATDGQHVLFYVSVRAEPVLFAWGFVAVLTYAILVAVFERESP